VAAGSILVATKSCRQGSVCFQLSVPVQLITWKDVSLKMSCCAKFTSPIKKMDLSDFCVYHSD